MKNSKPYYNAENKLKDAWLDGKLETALLINRHLNNFEIDTEVSNSIVYLTGTVKSVIDKTFAEDIAKNIDGVSEVRNNLQVNENYHSSQSRVSDELDRNFGTWFEDSTTTAVVKSKMLWESNIPGLDVNVNTEYGVVSLIGEVETSDQRQRAESIALNTTGVRRVENNLVIQSS